MQRVPSITYFPPHDPYRIRKRFRVVPNRKKRWYAYIYDGSEGKIFRNTPQTWFRVFVFYIIFYSGLALLWFICWTVFRATLPKGAPKIPMKQPGLAVQPVLSGKYSIDYDARKTRQVSKYVAKVDELLSKYGDIDPSHFAGCSPDNGYGFKDRAPCIFLKVNNAIGFKVRPYESADVMSANASEQLRTVFSQLPADEQKDHVWVSCSSNLTKQPTFTYSPGQSLPAAALHGDKMATEGADFFTPEDYQRIIAVKISNLPIAQQFNVKCFLWAKNIQQDETGEPGVGVVNFDVNVK